jgi:hypothetical protein
MKNCTLFQKFGRLTCLSLFVISVSGCTTLSAPECQEADWYRVGFTDGARGQTDKVFAEYVNSCSAYYLDPDEEEYRKGYEEGIKQYCQYKNGEALGQLNRLYKEVCPSGMQREIKSGYQSGKAIYDLRQQIEKDEKQLKTLMQISVDPTIPASKKQQTDIEISKLAEKIIWNKNQLSQQLTESPNPNLVPSADAIIVPPDPAASTTSPSSTVQSGVPNIPQIPR